MDDQIIGQKNIKQLSIDRKLSIEERQYLIQYIDEYIDKLSYNSKREILTMLKNSLDDKKLVEKGIGTQIKYSDIPNNLLIWISNKISIMFN